MSDHDPLCPYWVFHHPGGPSDVNCQCELITQVEQRQNERNAQALDAEAKKYRHSEERDYMEGIRYAADFVRRKR